MDSELGTERSAETLPREVRQLLRREREVATIVYELRAASANDVVVRLSARLTNATVRSMLNRLVAKGVLKRTLWEGAYLYLPDLSLNDSRELALHQFADDYFAGSISLAATTMKQLVRPGRSSRELL